MLLPVDQAGGKDIVTWEKPFPTGDATSHGKCQNTYLIRHQRGNGSANLMIGLCFALWSQQNEEKSDKTKRSFPFRMAKQTAYYLYNI